MLRIRKMKRLLSKYESEYSEEVQARDFKNKSEIQKPVIEEKVVSDSIDSNREKVYVTRIKNLEKFKHLYISRLEESQKLFTRIEKLKKLANAKPAPDLLDLQRHITKLESEKNELKKSLSALLNVLDQKTAETREFEQEQYNKLELLTEENEFLVVQIQYLLKQEVETTNNFITKIKHLEDTLASIENDSQ